MTTGIILPPEQMQLVLELANTHLPGVEIWAYGSRVRGNPRRYSDLDLVAFANPGQRPLADNLREAFEESDLPIRVDCSCGMKSLSLSGNRSKSNTPSCKRQGRPMRWNLNRGRPSASMHPRGKLRRRVALFIIDVTN